MKYWNKNHGSENLLSWRELDNSLIYFVKSPNQNRINSFLQAHNSLFKFGRQRSTMNIMSTLGEEKKIGDNFDEEDEQVEPEVGGVGGEVYCDDESVVIVKMRERKSLSRPQSDETSRVRSPSTQSLVLRGRDARGAPRWMLERSRSAYIKPW